MAKSKKTKKDATVSPNDLERVIAHLDTRYEQGLECTHPDTGTVSYTHLTLPTNREV